MSWEKYISTKVSGERLMWRARPIRSFQISANMKLAVVNHKGKLSVAVIDGNRKYMGCDRINYSEAVTLLGWLAHFINMVKPLEATAIYATGKAHLKGAGRAQEKLLGLIEAMRDD